MKKEFKVGDRVSVETPKHGTKIGWTLEKFKGHVVAIIDNGVIEVGIGPAFGLFVSPRQCRRLIKKERRRFFFSEAHLQAYLNGGGLEPRPSKNPLWTDSVEFQEVKPRRK